MTQELKMLDDAGKKELYSRLRRPDIFDRCHRYGWVITLIGTIALQLIVWSYSVGTFKQSVQDMKDQFGQRLDRLERQIDLLVRVKP